MPTSDLLVVDASHAIGKSSVRNAVIAGIGKHPFHFPRQASFFGGEGVVKLQMLMASFEAVEVVRESAFDGVAKKYDKSSVRNSVTGALGNEGVEKIDGRAVAGQCSYPSFVDLTVEGEMSRVPIETLVKMAVQKVGFLCAN